MFLPWEFCFCCEVFGFTVKYLVLRWHLWATVGCLPGDGTLKQERSFFFKVATKPDAEKQFHCICWQETDWKGYDGDRRFGLGWREFQTSLAKCSGKKRNLPCVSMQVAQYLHDQELLRRHPDLHLFWSRLTDLKENSTKRGFSQPYPRRCPQGTCLARCQSFFDRLIALASGFGPLSENVGSSRWC